MSSPARKKAKLSNEKGAEPNGTSRCAWRLDAETSYSDWTVVVRLEQQQGPQQQQGEEGPGDTKVNDDGDKKKDVGRCSSREEGTLAARTTEKTYHVHRSTLAYGPRGCGYFSALLAHASNQEFAESKTKTTALELPKAAFDAFESFLDYVYGEDERDCIDVQSAMPLCYLADRLDSPKLRKAAMRFVETALQFDMEDMDGTYIATGDLLNFVHHGAGLHTKDVEGVLIKFVLKYLKEYRGQCFFDPPAFLFPNAPPTNTNISFWVSALEEYRKVDHPVGVSCLAMDICILFGAGLQLSEFEKITSKKYWPLIGIFEYDTLNAVKVLKIEEAVTGKKVNGTGSVFQKRCVKHLPKHWKQIQAEPVAMEFFQSRPEFLACMVPKMLACATNDPDIEVSDFDISDTDDDAE